MAYKGAVRGFHLAYAIQFPLYLASKKTGATFVENRTPPSGRPAHQNRRKHLRLEALKKPYLTTPAAAARDLLRGRRGCMRRRGPTSSPTIRIFSRARHRPPPLAKPLSQPTTHLATPLATLRSQANDRNVYPTLHRLPYTAMQGDN